MFIPSLLKMNDSKSRILEHDKNNTENDTDLIKRQLRKISTNERVINRVIRNYKLMANNYCGAAARVVQFYSNESSVFRNEFFSGLYKYVKQFYSKKEEFKKIKNPLSLLKLFNKYYGDFEGFLIKYVEKLGLGIRCSWKKLNKIFDFYSIVEDFLIRFYGYSVIGIGGCKYIITSQSDCDKRFAEQLANGYKLIHLQKAYMKESKRYYGFLPALPTHDIGIPFEEYIEPSGKGNIVKTRKLLAVTKPRECNE